MVRFVSSIVRLLCLIDFCFGCEERHDLSDLDTCTKNKWSTKGAVDSRTTRSASRMAKSNTNDDLSELECSVNALSLEE